MKQTSIIVGTLLAIACVSGCLHKQPGCDRPILPVHTAFHESPIEKRPVRRIVVLPVENRAVTDMAVVENFQHSVAGAIREQQVYEVVEIPAHLRPACPQQWIQQGVFPEQVLADLYRQYSADAVLFVSINQLKPYGDVALSATVHLVDTDEGVVLSSVEGNWSTDNPNVSGAMHRKIQTEQSPQKARILLQSPRFLADFVADEIAAELANRKSFRR